MPNYITNKLMILGTDKQIEEVMNFIKIEKTEINKDIFGVGTIDFNKITPMPQWVCKEDLSIKEEEKYGKENCWYEWCIKNWGTKWNAFKQLDIRNTKNALYFETAWSGVPILIFKLAWMFPDVIIKYGWADEDFGYNVGELTYKDTEILESIKPQGGSKEAYELALSITQSTPQEHGLIFNVENNNYEFKEEDE